MSWRSIIICLVNSPAMFIQTRALLHSWFLLTKDAQDSCLPKVIYGASKTEVTKELHKAAAFYLSWLLGPLNKAHHYQLSECILETTSSWTMANRTNYSKEQTSNLHTCLKNTLNRSKKLQIPKVNDYKKLHMAAEKNNCAEIGVWLNKFDGSCTKLIYETVIRDVPATSSGETNTNMQLNFLIHSVPLGILLTGSSIVDGAGCELLFHYATTGVIHQLRKIQKESEVCLNNDGGDACVQALNGACLVFDLFDVEDISMMLFTCEVTRADFICQLKGKVSNYLLSSVKTLFELPDKQVGGVAERAMVPFQETEEMDAARPGSF